MKTEKLRQLRAGEKKRHTAFESGHDALRNEMNQNSALRIAATFFFIINLLGGAYIFRNRHRFFDRDPNVDNDIPAVRRIRVEVIMIPWLILTTLVLFLLITFWLA